MTSAPHARAIRSGTSPSTEPEIRKHALNPRLNPPPVPRCGAEDVMLAMPVCGRAGTAFAVEEGLDVLGADDRLRTR